MEMYDTLIRKKVDFGNISLLLTLFSFIWLRCNFTAALDLNRSVKVPLFLLYSENRLWLHMPLIL